MKKKKQIKYIILIIILLLIVVGLIRGNSYDKYSGLVKVSNTRITSKLLSSVGNALYEVDEVKGNSTVEYNVNYTLDEIDGVEKRDAIIKGSLSEIESRYARFKEINGPGVTSTLINNGKEIEVLIEDVELGIENNIKLKLIIENAPNNYEIKPVISVKESTGEYTNLNAQTIIVNTNSIQGIVKDENNLPVSNIEVAAFKNNKEVKRTYTNDTGEYVLTDLDAGTYIIDVVEDKYEVTSSKEKSVEGTTSLDLNIKEIEESNIDVHKYIEKLELIVDGKEFNYEYSDSDKVVETIKKAETLSGDIEYKLVVKNLGDKETKVNRLIDTASEGLKLKKEVNNGWEEVDGIFYYRPIEGISLKKNEQREIKLVLEIENTKEAKTYLNKMSTKGEIYEKIVYILDGEKYREEKLVEGDKLNELIIENDNFSGWYTDKNKTNKYNFNNPVTKDLILYGTTEVTKYNVNFIKDNQIINTVVVNKNDSVDEMTGPVKEGYTFKYWSLSTNGEAYDFNARVNTNLELYAVYEINKYTVKFYDGNQEYTKKIIDYNNLIPIEEITSPSKNHFTFKHWSIIENGNPYDFRTPVTTNMNLYAVYEINKYTVKFIDNGAVIKEEEVDANTIIQPVVVSKTGYNFKFWTENDTNAYDFTNPIVKDITFYSKYEIINYTITYNEQIEGNPSTYTVESPDIVLNNPSKTGYIFTGWTGDHLTNKTINVIIPSGSIGNREYNTNYSEIDYSISYNLNGGSLDNTNLNPTSYTINTNTITLNNPSKVGYTFIGWIWTGIEEPILNVTIPKGSIGNRNYEAKYKINSYDVDFYDQNNKVKTIKVEYQSTIDTSKVPVVTKEGYEFTFWSLKDISSAFDFSIPITFNLKLYSNYKIQEKEVLFDDENRVTQVKVNWGENVSPIDSKGKDGYTFKYWSLERNGEEFNFNTVITQPTTLYAVYEVNTYNISYDLRGGDLQSGKTNLTKYTIETEDFTLYNPIKRGYTFKGWSGTGISDNTIEVTIKKNSIGDREYVANYSIDTYEITYELNGGTVTNNPSSYTVETDSFTLNNPTKTGYTFKGWTEEGETTPVLNKIINIGTVGAKTIIANYEINKYTVNFINDGNPYSEDQIVEYNKKATRPENPSKTGYTFKYWSLKENGTEFSFDTSITKDTALYAVYEINKYTVNFIDQGVNYSEEQTIEYNKKATKPEDPSKTGYTFKYWSLTENGTEFSFNTNIINNITLYSVYEINKYIVNFIDQGVNYSEEQTVEYNKKATKPEDPSKTGYTFKYWSIAENGTEFSFDTNITKNTTLYSVYEINIYTVKYMNGDNQFAIEEVEYNKKTTMPSSNPTKEHNVFIGWTLDNELYNFNTPVTKDLILQSSFEEVVKPTITVSPLTWVNDHVTVTVSSSHNDYTYMYKIGDGEYKSYVAPFIVEENTIVYAYSIKSNVLSLENSKEIDNIDKINPVSLTITEGTITPVSISIDYECGDYESGVKTIKIYVNDILYKTTELDESVESYSGSTIINELEELTDYDIKLEAIDAVGNKDYINKTITTTAKTYVARIINIDNTDLAEPLKFETLKEAIEYTSCVSNECIIQMMEDVSESNSISNGQNITLDLNGKVITGTTNQTFNNNGIFKIIDSGEDGKIYNELGTAIYNTNFLEIGVDDETVSITKPIIEGGIYGIESTGTLNFYDGKIVGSTANKGTVTKTPYLYNASIGEDSETGKQVETLHQLADAVARINTTYYTELDTAIDKSKIGTIEKLDPPKKVDIINNYVMNSDTPFIIKDNKIVSTNHGSNSVGTGYLVIDLTNYTKDQIFSFKYTSSSETSDPGWIYITESSDIPTSGHIIRSGGIVENTFKRILKKGKKYYVHMKYSKDSSIDQFEDTFTLSDFTLQNFDQTISASDLNSNSNYSFDLTDDGLYTSNNTNISELASTYLTYDLTNEIEDHYLVMYAESSSNYGYTYAYLTNTSDSPNTNSTDNRIFYTINELPKTYVITLKAGEVNYLHIGFTNGYNNGYFKFGIKEYSKVESINEVPTIDVDEEIRLNEQVDTVEMLKDITLTSKAIIDEKRSVILDLNGHTLNTNSNDYVIENDGKLTIVDNDYLSQPANNLAEYLSEVERTENEYNSAMTQYNSDLAEYNAFLESGQIFYRGGVKVKYTGNIEAITIPVTGKYKLEAWGASGGYRTNENMAGLGGYTSGEIELNEGDIIFVNVGSSGITGGTNGGYNGGGSREQFPGGGGATDVRVSGNTLNNRILVAAGGGSDGSAGNKGGNAGGITGESRIGGWGSYGDGATQTAAGYNGSFGIGGSGISYAGGFGGAGGGGWYGGGACHPDGSGDDDGGGGGGSSFAYDGTNTVPEGYNVGDYVLTNTVITAGSGEMPTYDGTGTMTGNRGDGYFKITLIDEDVINELIQNEEREYTVTEKPIEPIKEIPVHDTDYELNGVITSTTNSVIYNKANAELIVEDANINTNISGTYYGIINEGKLTVGENAYINVNSNNNIGIYNKFNGDILSSSGHIIVNGNNTIGLKNESYSDTEIKGLSVETNNNTEIAVHDISIKDVTYSNLDISGAGIGMYIDSSKNKTINNSSIKSDYSDSIFNTNKSGKIDISNSSIKNRIYNTGSKEYTITDTEIENTRSYVSAIANERDGIITLNNVTSTVTSQNLNTINISNSATMTINNSELNNGSQIISNSGTLTVNDTEMNMDFFEGQLTIAVDNSGTINFNDNTLQDTGNVEISRDAYYGIRNLLNGTLNINSGKILGFNYGIVNNDNASTINLGNNEDSVSKTTPNIVSNKNSIYSCHTCIFNYYDGKLTGIKDDTIHGEIDSLPTNYDINVTKGETTETIVLDTKQDRINNEDYVARIGSTNFTSVQDAVDSITTSNLTEIVIIKDIETTTNITIDENKKIKINFNGHSIKNYDKGTFITNDGELELFDDSNSPKENNLFSTKLIQNNNLFKYNNVLFTMLEDDAEGIVNDGNVTFESGKLYASNAGVKNMVENNGIFSLTGGEISKISIYSGAIIINTGTLNISNGTIKTYQNSEYNSGYQLINSTTSDSIVTISNGTFIKHNRGNWIETSGTLNVSGGLFDSQNQDGTIYKINAGGNASITGGLYGIEESTKNELFINNTGTATVENVNVYYNVGFNNTGNLTLTNVKIPKLSDGSANSNSGTLTITGGEYKTTGSWILELLSSSTTNLTNTTIETDGGSRWIDMAIRVANGTESIRGKLNITGSTVKTLSTIKREDARSALQIETSYPIDITIKDSIIESLSGNGIYNNDANATITFGEEGGVPSKTSPSIKGAEYGLYNNQASATINFYDGIFTGLTNQAINGSVTNLESGYEILVKDNEDGTESKYLGISPLLINKETGSEYFDFATAVSEVGIGETLILNRNASILSTVNTITIDSTKDFIFDLNGKTLSQGNSLLFNNQGTFEITDNSDNVGEINTSSNKVIENSGTFTFDKGKIYSNLSSFGTLISNSGTLIINEGELTTNTQTDSIINNTGTITINGGFITNTSGQISGNMHLINSTGINSVLRITGGTFKKQSTGDSFYIEGRLIVTGGIFNGKSVDSNSDFISTFFISSTGIANITGGTYKTETNGTMYLINNEGNNTTIENITSNFSKLLINTGTINLNNVTANNLTSDSAINNTGTLTITGGEYTTLSSNLIKTNNSSITNLNNALLNSNNTVINNNASSEININGCTLSNLGNNGSGIYNDGSITLSIKNSSITSSGYGIRNKGTGTINIGDNSNSVDINSPTITGTQYGLISSNENLIVNIYDGQISGGTKAISAVINSIPSGYNLVTNTSSEIDTKYLSTENIIQNSNSGNLYSTFELAITNASNNDTLIILNDIVRTKLQGSIEIPTGKNIIVDLSNKEIISNNSLFLVNGSLTINSNNNLGKVFNINSNIFTNNGTLTINGGEYYSTEYMKDTIINNGTITINGGIFKTYKSQNELHVSHNMFKNNNNSTFNITDGSFITGGNGSFIVNNGTLDISGGTFNPLGYENQGYITSESNIVSNNGNASIKDITISGVKGKLLINNGTASIDGLNTNIDIFAINESGTLNISNTTLNNNSYISNSDRLITNNLTSNSTRDYIILLGGNSYTEINNSHLNTSLTNMVTVSNVTNVELVINNSEFTSTGTSVPYGGNGNQIYLDKLYNVTINNSTLTANLSNIGIHSNGSTNSLLKIINSSLKSNNSISVANSGLGTINIGEQGGTPSLVSPSITGSTYGLDNENSSAKVYFYDGIISGKTGSIYGFITDVEPGYKEVRNTTTIDDEEYHSSTLSVLGDEEIFATVSNINFSSLQSAVNYAVNNEIATITLYRNCTLESDLVKPAGIEVNIVLGNNTIDTNGFNIDSGIHLVSDSESGVAGAIYKFFASISNTATKPRNIVIYQMEDGSNLKPEESYKLYKYNDGNYDLVKIDEEKIGEYNLGSTNEEMYTVDSRLYLNGLGIGQYKIIGSDLKEIDFEIYDDSVSNNIRVNNKEKSNKNYESIATLILAFGTGMIRTPYLLIIGLILLIIVLGLLLKNQYKKKVQ